MADYSAQKVPDLKKILQDRGLAISGNKADLVARLQEDDKKNSAAAGGAEDEIDWDDDEKAAEAAPAPVAPAETTSEAPVVKAAPEEAVKDDAATASTEEQKKVEANPVVEKSENGVAAAEVATAAEGAEKKEPEAPKQDFTAGVAATDAEKEAERRAARAKKFGIVEDDEAKKLAERAKKFGADVKETVVKGLDSALPERRQKRGREDRRQGGRDAKRQTPDRRTEPRQQGKPKAAAPPQKKPANRILDDPAEKAKAEARAKKFGTPAS